MDKTTTNKGVKMKQLIAITLFFFLSDPAYGENDDNATNDFKEGQTETQMTNVDEQTEKDRIPASDNGSEMSLTEQHYLIYE